MNVLLVIWTVVGLSSGQSFGIPVYDWRPIGQFVSAETCERAAQKMDVKKYVCLQQGVRNY